MITPQQCRAGRALLDWPQRMLSAQSLISQSTIRDFESASREILIRNNRALREAMEAYGVVFSEDGTHGVSLAGKKEGSR